MELAVGVRLADLEGLTAVEKCSDLNGRGLSELTLYNYSPESPKIHAEPAPAELARR